MNNFIILRGDNFFFQNACFFMLASLNKLSIWGVGKELFFHK